MYDNLDQRVSADNSESVGCVERIMASQQGCLGTIHTLYRKWSSLRRPLEWRFLFAGTVYSVLDGTHVPEDERSY